MQTNQLNSDKANIASNGSQTSRKGFLRWAGLAAAGGLVLALALACTTPTPETPEKTSIASTERAEEMPAATATTAPAEATRESEAEKTPEAEPFEGTLRFIVVNGDDDSAARLAALNDQHGFESLFEARVGIESGVSAIAEIDMRDPAGRVMVRLKKDIPAGQNQPSEMAVKDLALSTETEAVIYQNEAEGLVFFWTESLGQAHFAPATQEMVGEAVAAPMFDVRRDKTGDANWIKAVVGSDAQGASVYQLTHESDDRGNWVKLANPITVLERETIFAEAGEVAILSQQLREKVLLPQLNAVFTIPGGNVEGDPIFETAMNEALTESGQYLRDTLGTLGDMELVIDNPTVRNVLLERTLSVLYREMEKELQKMVQVPEEHKDDPHYTFSLSTVLHIGGGNEGLISVPLTFYRAMPIEEKTKVGDYVPAAQSVWSDGGIQKSVSDQFVEIAEVGKPENFGVLPGAIIIKEDGTLARVRDLSSEDIGKLPMVYPDRIESYLFYETESSLISMMKVMGVLYYGVTDSPSAFWFMRQESGENIMVSVRVQSGSRTKEQISAEEFSLASMSTTLQNMVMARMGEDFDIFRPDRIDSRIEDIMREGNNCVNRKIIAEYVKAIGE